MILCVSRMFIQEDVYHSVAKVAHIMIFVNFVQNSSCNTYFTFKPLEHNYFLFLKKIYEYCLKPV